MDFVSFLTKVLTSKTSKKFSSPMSFHSQVRFMANVTFSSSSLYAHWIDANIGHMPNPYINEVNSNSKPPPQQARIFEQPCPILGMLMTVSDRISPDFSPSGKKAQKDMNNSGHMACYRNYFSYKPTQNSDIKTQMEPRKKHRAQLFLTKFLFVWSSKLHVVFR